MHREMTPQSYFACGELIPLALELLSAKACVWGISRQSGAIVKHHAIVEHRVPQRRNVLHLVEECSEFLRRRLLLSDFLALHGRWIACPRFQRDW